MKWSLFVIVTVFTLFVAWILGDALAAYFNSSGLGVGLSFFVCYFMGRGVGAELVKYL